MIKNIARMFVGLLGITLLVIVLISHATEKNNRTNDLLNYLTGAVIIKNGDIAHLYDKNTQIKYQQELAKPNYFSGLFAFRTPPTTAFLYMPLLYLPQSLGFYVTCAINLLFLMGTLVLLFKMTLRTKDSFIDVLVFLPYFYPLWHCLINYQLGIILTFITALSIFLITRQKFLLAGLCIGFLLLKPTFLIVIVALIFWVWSQGAKKTINFLMGFTVTLLFFIVANTLLYGFNFVHDYINFVAGSESLDYGTIISVNYNLTMVFWFLLKNESLARLFGFIAGILGFALVGYFAVNNRNKRALQIMCGLLILLPILFIHTMPNDLVIWIIPLFLFNYSVGETAFVILSPFLGFVNLHYLTVIGAGFIGARNLYNQAKPTQQY